MADGWIYWFATANVLENMPSPPQQCQHHVAARFGDWQAPIPALIAATDPGSILHNDIYARRFTIGRGGA